MIWAPLLWLGNSHHHLDFAGTLSAAPRTYLDLLGDLIDNLVVARLPPDRAPERPRGQHRAGSAGGLRGPPALPRARRPAPAGGDLLAAGRQAGPGRSLARAGSDGPRLRVGDLDDPAPGAPPGRRAEPRSSRSRTAMPFEPASRGWITRGAEPASATSATPAAPPPRRARRSSASSPTTSSPSWSG